MLLELIFFKSGELSPEKPSNQKNPMAVLSVMHNTVVNLRVQISL